MNPSCENQADFDVIVIGGAISGAATAFLLKRRNPSLWVAVVEKNTVFKRRVGEATTEVSSFFLTRVLGLTNFLARTQISKNGLRFWFYRNGSGTLADCSELGGKYLSTVPAYLIDRSVLDEEMLRRAVAEGVELIRPAQVKSVSLHTGGLQEVVLSSDGVEKKLCARWVVDASGLKAELARANGWMRPNTDHPTLAVWSRWRNTGDWDGLDTGDANWGKGFYGIRGTATNHFVGEGWWAWWIQLQSGEVSIGAVIDQRLADWKNSDATVGEKLRNFLSRHPAARELMKDAEFVEGDVHFRRNLPYCSEKFAGDGFTLVGDASAFLDPLYSPGMDWIAYTVSATVALILKWREGEELAPLVEKHNCDFRVSYERMFGALYRDKYEYLGDHDLMRVAFRLDIASYYLYVARFLFQNGAHMLETPPFSPWQAEPFFRLMALYNRRLAAMARARRARGEFGKNNQGRRDLVPGFNFRLGQLFRTVFEGFGLWLALEFSEGWRSWFSPLKKSAGEFDQTPMTAQTAAAHP